MAAGATWFAVCLMVAAAWQDCRSYRIANVLCLGIGFLAAVHAFAIDAIRTLPWLTAALLLVAGVLLWRAGVMGAGDVKLVCACSLWFPERPEDFILLTACFGGAVALSLLVWARLRGRSAPAVPYGVAIGSAGMLNPAVFANAASMMPG